MGKIEVGSKVVFLGDIVYKTDKSTRYDAKVGQTGEVKGVTETDSKTFVYEVQLDKTFSTKRALVKDVDGARITPVIEPMVHEVQELPKKPKAYKPWRKFDYEPLVSFAQSHGIDWKRNPNEKVDRMQLVAALKASGIQEPEKLEIPNGNGGVKIVGGKKKEQKASGE